MSAEARTGLPAYAALPRNADGIAVSWGLFGEDDELGTVNLLDAAAVRRGLAAAVDGAVHSLNWQVDLPRPNPFRPTPQRVQLAKRGTSRDDYLEPLYLQFSTQWDGLRHVGLPSSGFYNETSAGRVDDPGEDVLGIHRWAEHGIVGRGVLLDAAAAFAEAGRAFDPMTVETISVEDLDTIAARQRVTLEPGDILLVRTGWIEAYEALDQSAREALDVNMTVAGLEPSERMAAWLWNHGVAAIAADNTGVEPMPLVEGFPLGALHGYLIAGLGMPYGELFRLDGLAAACRAASRWTFLFTAAPLNVRGGVGSPANALAVT